MLSLVAAGTTGPTLDQLLLFLGSKSMEGLNSLCSQVVELTALEQIDDENLAAGPLVTMVNGAWIDQRFGLKSSFKEILKDVYRAEAKSVDFETRASQVTEVVNNWAKDATKGLIKELLPSGSLGSDTALVFANALYFKGTWDRKFDSQRTMHKDFNLLTGQIVQVPFITTKRKERNLYREIYGYKILKLPYQNGQDNRKFAMYFFQKQDELLKTLGDFTSKENWDEFFRIRGNDDSFEWYSEWPQLSSPLLSQLSDYQTPLPDSVTSGAQILVPGCGNSKLSEHLYDVGFRDITNVDFSKVVISDMLRRNVRSRPGMRWRVMDMTSLQFVDETFDVVLDKGGLDALMEPELGSELGNLYLSEVKRVLKEGGKFICLTLAEAHVLGLLFPKFRYGWSMSLQAVPQKPSKKPSLTTFMLIAKKESSLELQQVSSSIHSSISCYGDQARGLFEALETENMFRTAHLNGSDILYSLEDLQLGSKGDLSELRPGRRIQLTLGEPGRSQFLYKAVLLDAQQQSDSFLYHCGVFLVPKTRAHEWIFSSEEGQWTIIETSKAARLIMVLLDSSHASASSDDIQKDLSPLVKQLEPGKNESGARIPFMAASDGIKKRNVVHQVASALTGPVTIDDVVYENVDDDISRLFPSKELIFRRLTFERCAGLIQSEALLTGEGCKRTVDEKEQKKSHSSSKSKKRGSHRGNSSNMSQVNDTSGLEINHDYLASSYHTGIVSGLMLISSFLETVSSSGGMVKAVVIGLGAGLLPMFLHRSLPFLNIEVVELDAVILDLARDYFGYRESDHMKVHITDGIQFVKDVAALKGADAVNPSIGSCCPSNVSANDSKAEGKWNDKIDILIVDVDSSDSSSGMTCPAADFVEESFLLTVRNSLSEAGLFVVNLVSRSASIKDLVLSRMKMVFSDLFSLQLEEDVNEVIFALTTKVCVKEDSFCEASHQLGKLLKLKHPEWTQNITDKAMKIKRLK